jgi:hypothetical protein
MNGATEIEKAKNMEANAFLGIFVNPTYIQNEGTQQVFDNIESIGCKAICFPPRVARLAEAGKGVRVPPLHTDGYERLLGRPVWGRRELYLEYFLAYEPDLSLYEGGPYQPAARRIPRGVDQEVPSVMISEAKMRGMQVHILIHPFLPPNVQADDQPMRVDGSVPQPPQVALSACLNNPAARAYGLALVEDTMQHYPKVDGLFTDWVEYGAYRLEDHFTCFCPHCERKGQEQGFDWPAIRRDVAALWDWLHSLTPRELERSRRLLRNPSELLELLTHYPGWLGLLRFKAQSVLDFYGQVRQLLDKLGFEQTTISARGWPPPWNRSSGMDYRALAGVCGAVTPKLFTFDYSALPRWYGETLLAWNPDLSESAILDALVEWMNLPDDFERRSFANYHIPAPAELHPARIEVYQTRLDEVVDQVGGNAYCYPFAHAYLPERQWKRMVAMIRDSRVDGMWVQMYGYLSDRKLEILKEMWT